MAYVANVRFIFRELNYYREIVSSATTAHRPRPGFVLLALSSPPGPTITAGLGPVKAIRMEAERDTPYQPLDGTMSNGRSRQCNDNGTDCHKQSESPSLDGSPTPLIRGGSGSNRTHFDVSSESGGGSDGEGGFKMGKTGRGQKKAISFWVMPCEANHAVYLFCFPDSIVAVACTAHLFLDKNCSPITCRTQNVVFGSGAVTLVSLSPLWGTKHLSGGCYCC